MLRKLKSTICLLLFVLTSHFFYGQKAGFNVRTVVIDAGHGGKDPGAHYGNVKEKDIVLNVALITGRLITQQYPDVKVIYTRDKDMFPALHERAEIANKNKADLFISIHANAIKNTATYGTETFIIGQHKTEENLKLAQLENSVIMLEEDYSIRYEGFNPSSAESYIMFELIQNEFIEQSRIFADFVETNFTSVAKRKSRGVKQAGFLVLWKTTMPSVLIELGFISNQNEQNFLVKKENQELMAKCIANAFSSYKSKFEPKAAQPTPKPAQANQTQQAQQTAAQQTAAQNTKPEIKEQKTKTTDTIGSKPNTPSTKQEKLFIAAEEATLNASFYAIQLAASPTQLRGSYAAFAKTDTVYTYFENGLYKYYCGLYTSHDQFSLKLSKVKKIVTDAFPVVFINGKKEKFRKF